MTTYRDYLKNLIMESTESDDVKGVLIAAMEDAESIYELDAIGVILEEANEDTKDDLTLKEKQDLSGASTAKADGTNAKKKIDLYNYEGNLNEEDYEDAMNKFDEGIGQIENGDIEEGCETCAEAIGDGLKVFFGVASSEVKKAIESDEEIKKDVEKLKEDVKALKDKSKSDDTSASEAKSFASKCRVRLKLIGNRVKSVLNKMKKDKAKATTESALDAIFEGVSDGIIDDDDMEFLVDAMSKVIED